MHGKERANSEIRNEIFEFDKELKYSKAIFKNAYNQELFDDYFKLARKMNRIILPKSFEEHYMIEEEELAPFFIDSLKIFNQDKIVNYFINKIPSIRIVRDKDLEIGDADMRYYRFESGKAYDLEMHLPDYYLSTIDRYSYAHEMGHIPELDLVRKSYYEYIEAIPIFMEFLIPLNRYKNFDKAFDAFLLERMPIEQDGASELLKEYNAINNCKDKLKKIYFEQQFKTTCKYLESFDFAIQFIYLMRYNPNMIGNELSSIINGKSLIDVSKDLDIDTLSCGRVLNEIKRLSK